MTTAHASAHPNRATNRRHRGGTNEGLSAIAEVVRAEVRRELDHLRERAGEIVERGKSKAIELKDGVADRVSERPMAAILVAAGVGLLVGIMVGRRR